MTASHSKHKDNLYLIPFVNIQSIQCTRRVAIRPHEFISIKFSFTNIKFAGNHIKGTTRAVQIPAASHMPHHAALLITMAQRHWGLIPLLFERNNKCSDCDKGNNVFQQWPHFPLLQHISTISCPLLQCVPTIKPGNAGCLTRTKKHGQAQKVFANTRARRTPTNYTFTYW